MLFSANNYISNYSSRTEGQDLPRSTCQLCEDQAASEASKARRCSKGNLNYLRSISHLHAPAEKMPAKIYSSLALLPEDQAILQRFLTPIPTVSNGQRILYLKLILTSKTMQNTFLFPTPSHERHPLLAQQCECQKGEGLLTLTHLILQLLEKSKYTVPPEKAKTRADVKTDLHALFHLAAAL